MRLPAAALFIVLSGAIAPAEIIDRIGVSVGSSVITETEINRQIRITAFLNRSKPDLSTDAKRDATDKLVDQALMRRELQTSGYGLAEPKAIEPVLKDFKAEHFKSEAEYQASLREYKLTDKDIREAIQWQISLLRFIDIRFRPGIQIPETEIKSYYEQQYLPERAKNKQEGVPTFEESRDAVEKILTDQRVDAAVDRWLGQARTQTRIRYRQEVFR